MSRGVGRIARLLVITVPLFFAWEMLQMRGFTGLPAGWLASVPVCSRATGGDVVIVFTLYGLGWLVFGDRDWFKPPTPRRYAAIVLAGIAIQLAVEWVEVYRLDRWGYSPLQPLVPGLSLGVLPVLQAVALLALTFWLLARWEARAGR